jgi:hypothetical protein
LFCALRAGFLFAAKTTCSAPTQKPSMKRKYLIERQLFIWFLYYSRSLDTQIPATRNAAQELHAAKSIISRFQRRLPRFSVVREFPFQPVTVAWQCAHVPLTSVVPGGPKRSAQPPPATPHLGQGAAPVAHACSAAPEGGRGGSCVRGRQRKTVRTTKRAQELAIGRQRRTRA